MVSDLVNSGEFYENKHKVQEDGRCHCNAIHSLTKNEFFPHYSFCGYNKQNQLMKKKKHYKYWITFFRITYLELYLYYKRKYTI